MRACPDRHGRPVARSPSRYRGSRCRNPSAGSRSHRVYGPPVRAASAAESTLQVGTMDAPLPPPSRQPALAALVMLHIAEAAPLATAAHSQIELPHVRITGEPFGRTINHHLPHLHDVAVVGNG